MIFARLLKPGPSGTHVDVGANNPIGGSNTFGLYLRGWRGLAIDPNPTFAAAYEHYRTQDLFLAEGVSQVAGRLTYHQFEHDADNTFDRQRVGELIADGNAVTSTSEVRCRPLADTIAEHLGDRQIDLLNIDCEGMDLEVISSIDFDVNRPTVLIGEDFGRYDSFRQGGSPSAFDLSLRGYDYLPVAQSAWSAIFIARDWQRLFKRSDAFDEARVQNGYLPGQT